MAYGFIYITENLINGKKYIGQRVYKGRWQYYLGSGTLLKKAIKAYGASNFSRTVIYEASNLADLNRAEKHFIALYNAVDDPNWYNLTEGGKGSITRGFAGRRHSMETRAKMRQSQLGHAVSDKTRRAVAVNGRKSSQDPVARAKQAAAISGVNHPRARSVTIDGITYPTITDAVKATGLRYGIARKIAVDPTFNPFTPKPYIIVDGCRYDSIPDAMRKLGWYRGKVEKHITTSPPENE